MSQSASESVLAVNVMIPVSKGKNASPSIAPPSQLTSAPLSASPVNVNDSPIHNSTAEGVIEMEEHNSVIIICPFPVPTPAVFV